MDLRDRQLTFHMIVDGWLVIILVQDPTYLAQIVKEDLNHAIEVLGMRIWEETLRRFGMAGNINSTNSLEPGH